MSEWKQIPLDSFVREGSIELGRGDIISRDDIANDPGPYPIYSSSAKGDGRFGQYGKHMFDEELITWSVDGGGRLFYRPRHRYSVTNVCGYVRLRDNTFVYRFVHYLLDFQHRYIAFDYQTKAHPSVIRHLYFLVPLPLPEQRKIARILTTVDNLIEQTEALIEKYKSIKQGMMHDLFTRGVDSNGKLRPTQQQAPELYKESELGWIPKEWDVNPLSAMTASSDSITYGVLKPGPFVPDGIPLLQIQDVIHGDIEGSSLHRISKELDQQYGRTRLHGGEIVMSLVGTIGRVAEIPTWLHGSNLHRNLGLIRIEAPHVPRYILHYLQTDIVKSEIEKVTFGSTQALLNLDSLRNMSTLIPSPEEQTLIAGIADGLDSRIKSDSSTVYKLKHLKTGLMQDLLTGKVRVNVDEVEEVTADV